MITQQKINEVRAFLKLEAKVLNDPELMALINMMDDNNILTLCEIVNEEYTEQ
jgi:hypothetical protein